MLTIMHPLLLIRSERISKWGSSAEHTIKLLKEKDPQDYTAVFFNFPTDAERKAIGLGFESEPNWEDSVTYTDLEEIKEIDDALGLGILNAEQVLSLDKVEEVKADIMDILSDIKTSSRNLVADILKRFPKGELVSESPLGYLTFLTNNDEWVEQTIHALRIDENGNIRVTTEVDYDNDLNPFVEDWNDNFRSMTFDEDDNYSKIDWPGTFLCITDCLKNKKD